MKRCVSAALLLYCCFIEGCLMHLRAPCASSRELLAAPPLCEHPDVNICTFVQVMQLKRVPVRALDVCAEKLRTQDTVRPSACSHAYVSIRQHTSTHVSIPQHTSAYLSIRQNTSAYVSIRQHTSAYVSIHQHTSAYISIRQHTSTLSIRQHTSAYVRPSA